MSDNRSMISRSDEEAGVAIPAARGAYAVGGALAQGLTTQGRGGDRPHSNLLTVVWRRRWVVVGCLVLALAGAIYESF